MLASILLIEDNDPVVRLLTLLLRRQEGFDIDVAPNLEEAREKLRHAKTIYDCVVLDLTLSATPESRGTTGSETLVRALEIIRDRTIAPVVVYSSDISSEIKDECLRLGAFAYICKSDRDSSDMLSNSIVDAIGVNKPRALAHKPMLIARQRGIDYNPTAAVAVFTALIINAMLIAAFAADLMQQIQKGNYTPEAWELAVMTPAVAMMIKYLFDRKDKKK